MRVRDFATAKKVLVDPSQMGDTVVDHYSLPAFDMGRAERQSAAEIKSAKVVVEPGAVLVSKLNPHIPRVWRPSLSTDLISLASTEFVQLHPKSSIDPTFMFHVLSSRTFLRQLAPLVTGTTGSHQRVKTESILDIELNLPDVGLQPALARAPEAIFQLEQHNELQRALLLRLSSLVFEREFDSRSDSAQLGDVATITDCLHSRKPQRANTGRPLLQLNNVRDDGQLELDELFSISDEDYARWTKNIELREWDAVITNVGRVGAVARIPGGFVGALGRNMTAIRPFQPEYGAFVACCLLGKRVRDDVRRKTDVGTVMEALNVRSIPSLQIPASNHDERVEFGSRVGPLFVLADYLLSEGRRLSQMRTRLTDLILLAHGNGTGS